MTLAATLFEAPAARAAGAPFQGWWSQLNPGGLQGAYPPDVPADGLLVQGGPNGPTAFSAVRYRLDQGETPTTLTLSVAGTPTQGSSAMACAVTAATVEYAPVQNGPMSAAPVADCAHPVAGAPSADGTKISFVVRGFASPDLVAVAILPGSPTTRIAFAHAGPVASDPAPASGGVRSGAPLAPSTEGGGGGAASASSGSSPAVVGGAAGTTSGGGGGAFSGTDGSSSPAARASLSPLGAVDAAASPAPPAVGDAATQLLPARSTAVRASGVVVRRRSSTASAVGGACAIALLLVALGASVQEFGLLGGRFADPATRSRPSASSTGGS